MLEQVKQVLAGIDDPEMPISIVDLGIVADVSESDGVVRVVIIPTFVGCPALDMLRSEIETRVGRLPGVRTVDVSFDLASQWSPLRISAAGQERLRSVGVTVPHTGQKTPGLVQLGISASVPCPFCGAADTRLESAFGPTRCRMIYHCLACGNPFEHMKDVGAANAAPTVA